MKERVLAVVRRPDGEVAAPGDAALGSFPKQLRVGMLGKFIQANVAPINGHGLRMGGESEDAGLIVEFDVADFDFVGETGGAALLVEARHFEVIFALRENDAGTIKELGKPPALADVLEGAGIILGGEEIIAFAEMKALANVFESIGISPANADGFFGQRHHLLL